MDASQDIKSKKCLVKSYLVSYKFINDDIKYISIPNDCDCMLDNRSLNKLASDEIEKLTSLKPKKIFKNKLMFGTCPLCDQNKELKRSHVIGASVFSKILKLSSVNAGILVSLNEKKITLSNDNWTTYMLCNKCEGHFNSEYEGYAINALRNKIEGLSIERLDHSLVYCGIDTNKIILYILSIYWRGALSTAPSYNKILMTNGINENLKSVFLGNNNYNSNLFKLKISKIIDFTHQLEEIKMQYFIINPFVRMMEEGLVYWFIFEGFVFQLFMNCNETIEKENIKGIIDNTSSQITMSYVDYREIPEILEVLHHGLDLVQVNERLSIMCQKEYELSSPSKA